MQTTVSDRNAARSTKFESVSDKCRPNRTFVEVLKYFADHARDTCITIFSYLLTSSFMMNTLLLANINRTSEIDFSTLCREFFVGLLFSTLIFGLFWSSVYHKDFAHNSATYQRKIKTIFIVSDTRTMSKSFSDLALPIPLIGVGFGPSKLQISNF